MNRLLRLLLAAAALMTASVIEAQLAPDEWRSVSPPAGEARQIAIGGRGVVGAIDPSGTVYRRNTVSGAWQQVATGMSRLAIDAAGTLWTIDLQGTVQRQEGSIWRKIGAGAIALAASPDGSIIVATNNGSLARYDPLKASWAALEGTGTRIAVDARGLIWSVDAKGAIARKLGDAWVGVSGAARDIAADPLGNVVMVGLDGKVYEWSENDARWNEVAGASSATTVAVGAGQLWRTESDGRMFAKGIKYAGPELKSTSAAAASQSQPALSNRILSGTPERVTVPDNSPLEFQQVAAATSLAALSIGYDGSIFGATSGGSIQRWSNAQRKFNNFPGALARLQVNEAGLPFGTNGSSALLQHDGVAWRKLPLQYAMIGVSNASDAVLMAISVDSQLYRLNIKGGSIAYTRLAGNVEQVAAAPDGGFWYRNTAGLLFACDKDAQCERRGLSVADIAIGPGGTVFAVDTQGNLQQFNKTTGNFDILRRTSVAKVAVGPNDRPWIIDKSGNVLASRLFLRDESQDILLARVTEASANVTQPDATTSSTGGGVMTGYNFLAVDVPTTAGSFGNIGAGLNDITVGLDDQIIVTGFDTAYFTPCATRTTGWQGRNWIYSPTQRRFIHLDYLKRVQYQVAFAARNVAGGTAPPALTGAPNVPAFFGITRACERYYLNEYDAATFNGQTADFYDAGGRWEGRSLQRSSEVTVNTRDINTVGDMDVTLDEWIVLTFTQRMINFIGIGANAGLSRPKRSDQKFTRIGVGATRDVIWATTFDNDVYEYVKATDRYEKRNVLDSDKAQDIGVGKDGSVFIVDLSGRLKKWDAAQKTFVFTGRAGVNRVAVTSKGKPVVANFPSSQRVFIAQ